MNDSTKTKSQLIDELQLLRIEVSKIEKQRSIECNALIEAIPDAILRIHRDGTYLDIKAPAAYKSSVPAKQAIGQRLEDILPLDVATVAKNYLDQALQTGKAQEFEYTIQVDDQWYTREARVVPAGEDEVIVIVRDITERKKTELTLRQNESRIRALLEAIPDAIARVHRDGTILNFKAASSYSMIGPDEQVIGRNQGELFPPHLSCLLNERNRRALETGTVQTLEYEIAIEGERRFRESRAVPVNEEEVITIVRDITERKEAEEELRRVQAELEAIYRASPDVVLFADLNRRIRLVNPAFTRMFGYAPDEVQGKHTSILYTSRKVYEEQGLARFNLKAEEHLIPYEIAYRRKSGEVFMSETVGTIAHDRAGDPVGYLAIIRDVTERKQQEKVLHQTESRNRALLEAIPDSIGRIHRDGTCLEIHLPGEFELITSTDNIVGRKQHDFLPPDLADRVMRRIELALNTNEAQDIEYDIEVNGHLRSREARLVPNDDDEVIAIIRDVTERRIAMEALRTSEERNRALLEAIPDAVLHLNRAGIYIDAKASRELVPMVPVEQLIGKNIRDVLGPPLADRFLDVMGKALDQNLLQVFEYDVRRDDRLLTREGRVVPVRNDEAIFILRDITERKETEVENERLLSEVSQQSKQLRALALRLAELQENERQELARELHDQVGQNLSTLGLNLNIIQAQMGPNLEEAGQTQTLLQDSHALLKQTTERVRSLMAELRPPMLDDFGLPATLNWYVEQMGQRGGFVVNVIANEASPRLGEIVENALFRITQEAMTNVLKHANATQVDVHLQRDTDAVRLTIADNGCGFELVRPDGTGTPTSWGLLNMRERAEAIGGRFIIESKVGSGTTVRIAIFQ